VRVLVLGGLGFIGSHVTRRLLDHGHEVVVQDVLPSAYSMERHAVLSEAVGMRHKVMLCGARLAIGGPHEPDLFGQLLREVDPEVVVHLIGAPLPNYAETHLAEARRHLLDSTAATIEALQFHGRVRRLVFVSSSMVYGEFAEAFVTEDAPKLPVNAYGALKLAAETLVRTCVPNLGIEYTIIRPSAVYGPYDVHGRVVQVFCERALRGLPIVMHAPDDHQFDFTYVSDLAAGITAAATCRAAVNQAFNLATGRARSLVALAEILRDHFPDLEVVRDVRRCRVVPKRGALSIAKAQAALGYRPEYDLETGIAALLEVMRGQRVAAGEPAWS
jgi:UDP-glucose 4-epimerase